MLRQIALLPIRNRASPAQRPFVPFPKFVSLDHTDGVAGLASLYLPPKIFAAGLNVDVLKQTFQVLNLVILYLFKAYLAYIFILVSNIFPGGFHYEIGFGNFLFMDYLNSALS